MVGLNTLISTAFITALASSVVAAPTYGPLEPDHVLIEREATELVERQTQRFATQYWANENAKLTWKSGNAGQYSVNWSNPDKGNFVVGKGYMGQGMLFNYSGTFTTTGNAYLGLYGWTTDPLVEYYVIENFGDKHNPTDNSNHTCYGTFDSDGGTYEVWRKWRINAPSILGTATFPQYWSVRTKRHTGGTVNTTRHFEKWAKAGLPLGKQRDGMVMGIEGQNGAGAATITAGVKPTRTAAETTTLTNHSERPRATNTCTRKL